jgi:capsular polysaccharide export protein
MLPQGPERRFLFLQGPHGPWFFQLAQMLRRAGCQIWRVGFNAGDEAFWRDHATYIAFRAQPEAWPSTLTHIIEGKQITDLVIYGDTRPVHATAVQIARELGLTIHVFEEGYLRPHWITYERGGSNGHSRLMDLSVADMAGALERSDTDLPDAPARWGDTRQHVFYGALYHWLVLTGGWRYPNFRPHRALTVRQEFRVYLRRLATLPFHAIGRMIASYRIARGGFPYHLVLLQLEHDSNFQAHSPFATMTEFLDCVTEAFAKGAPGHHHLVFKAHPLEDGRAPVAAEIRRLARQHGLQDRVHFVRGGKLARLLNQARSAVTVNSTAAQQVLWRGLPLKALGQAIYSKPEFVSDQSLSEFFSNPARPDSRAYRLFRHFLLETSQVPGGFYSARGRRALLRQVVDMLLMQHDPYDALSKGQSPPRQLLRIVK